MRNTRSSACASATTICLLACSLTFRVYCVRRDANQLRRVLVGAKADLARDVDEEGSSGGGGGGPQREVSYETARAWAAERLMSYVEVSAKTDANVNAALLTMVSEIAEAAAAAGGD